MAQPTNIDRTIALFERPAMGVTDEATFNAVKQDIESCFAATYVEKFMKSLERAGQRVRDFEAVLTSGKLGVQTAALYAKLSNGDRGQIRELYLALLEKVDLATRDKFFKLYAYY
jgi:hypothetical protein